MEYNLKIEAGRLTLESEQREHFMKQLKAAMRIESAADRIKAVSQIVYPPIRKVADYMEWSQYFFVNETVTPGSVVRIAQDEYTAYAFYSSPDGGIMYTRPWRKYTTIDWRQIRVGLELEWGIADWGWDVVSTKMLEVAEELARRRDELRQPLLDAAAISQAGHCPEVATTLSKASVDSIIQTSATNGFPVTQVAVNIGTLMDMTGWTLPANSMINGAVPESIGSDILTKLYTNGYGGLRWIANHSIPSNYLYFSGPVNKVGWFFTNGGARTASEQDIDRDVDKHTWRQEVAAHVEGSHWVWRLEIT
jgi:hypothetical protein